MTTGEGATPPAPKPSDSTPSSADSAPSTPTAGSAPQTPPIGSAAAPATESDAQAPPAADDVPALIHKGCYVVVTMYIEGDDAPAHDFAEVATSAARDIIQSAIDAQALIQTAIDQEASSTNTQQRLTYEIKKVEAEDDMPDDE